VTILGVDVSHFQGFPNWPQVKASARAFCVLKATESTSFVDPNFAANRKAAHAAGLIVGIYHFARAGNAAAEAAYFLKTIGTLQPGEFLVLDWEVPGANPPAWCKQWLDAVYAATGVRPLIYMNSSAMSGSNWSTVAADYGLWLAKYDNSTAQPAVKWWAGAAMKQFSDRGVVPGIGSCDVDVFYGSEQQLLAYGYGGGDDDMTPEQDARQKNIEAVLGRLEVAISDPNTGIFKRVGDLENLFCGGPGVDIPPKSGVTEDNNKVTNLSNQILYAAAKLSKLAGAADGSVDAQAVIAGVLAGLNGAQLNVQQAAK
jgi:lysozyme